MNLFLKILVAVCVVGFCMTVGALGGCLITIVVSFTAPNSLSSVGGGDLGQWLIFVPMILGAILGFAGGAFLAHRINNPPPPPPR